MSFDFSQIGLVIKELRITIGMNQNVLCRGICSQSQLSKIESGEALPMATTLYLLSNRLGVTMNYIFDMTADGRLDYVLDVKEQIRKLVRKKDYQTILEIVQKEEENPNFKKNPSKRQFLLWHKGISTYYIEKEGKKALDYLEEALSITKSNDRFLLEQEIEILNSIGGILFEIGKLEESLKLYEKTLENMRRAPVHSYSLQIKVRILFNFAKSKTKNKEYKDAIEICEQAIQLSLEHESLYLLGELNYYVSYNYTLSGKAEKGRPNLDQAETIFRMTNKKQYINKIHIIREEIDKQQAEDSYMI